LRTCAAIESALSGLDLGAYRANRLVRSAVEREFILIGEAVASLIRLEPSLSERISHSRRIIGFRNLAHLPPSGYKIAAEGRNLAGGNARPMIPIPGGRDA